MARRGRVYYDRAGNGRFFIDGEPVTQAQYDAAFPSKFHQLLEPGDTAPATYAPSCFPMESLALKVHKSQVAEANERNKRHGIATRYKPDGTAVIPDAGDRVKLMRLERLHDCNEGYRG